MIPIWIGLVIWSIIITYISFLANKNGIKGIIGLYIANGIIQFWPIVCYYSKNILIDALIYDAIVLFCYYGTLIYLGTGSSLTYTQWIGTFLIIIGIVMAKI